MLYVSGEKLPSLLGKGAQENMLDKHFKTHDASDLQHISKTRISEGCLGDFRDFALDELQLSASPVIRATTV